MKASIHKQPHFLSSYLIFQFSGVPIQWRPIASKRPLFLRPLCVSFQLQLDPYPIPRMQQMQQALDQPHLAFLGVSLLVSGLLYTFHRYRRSNARYPPGPPPDPILGNVRQFPKTAMHNTFTVWQKQYGQVVPCTSSHHSSLKGLLQETSSMLTLWASTW